MNLQESERYRCVCVSERNASAKSWGPWMSAQYFLVNEKDETLKGIT